MTILYFSATGNSKYVATRLAGEKGKALFIPDLMNEGVYRFEDEVIGIISPTYFWGLPSLVKEFLEKATFHADYLYFLATYGTTPGASGSMAKELIKGKGVDAVYGVAMVDTYTPIFDLSSEKKRKRFTKHTEEQIDSILISISKREGKTKMKGQVPLFVVKTITEPLYDNKKRLTSRLKVNSNCIGCGLCAKKCPVKAIEMKEGKPVWVKDKCAMCLGCLHRCPKFAIECGSKSKKHGQYQNPNARV